MVGLMARLVTAQRVTSDSASEGDTAISPNSMASFAREVMCQFIGRANDMVQAAGTRGFID